MPLSFEFKNIRDWESVCYIDTPGGRKENPVTQALVMGGNNAGYRRITANNATKIYERLTAVAAIVGPPLQRGDAAAPPWYITEQDVLAHVGLFTNWAELTDAAFNKNLLHLVESARRSLAYKLENGAFDYQAA
jgi:hypothetical protein